MRAASRGAKCSNVDLIVLVESGRRQLVEIDRMIWDAAEAEAANPFAFSVIVETPDWPDRRRAIRDLFIAEVDKDRVEVA